MSDLSIVFGSNEILTHTNLNAVLQELEGFTRAITPAQLLGGITLDKLADNAAWSTFFVQVIPMVAPYTSTEGAAGATIANNIDGANVRGFIIPAAWFRMVSVIQPVVKPGWECDLCAYLVHAQAYDEGANTDAPEIRVRRNGTVTVGAAEIVLNVNNNNWLVANNDPIANPISPMADGDYLEIEMRGPSGTPRPRGIGITFVFKHTLVAG